MGKVNDCSIWYHLHKLKKCEKHPWRSVISVMGVFHIFLNCANGIKLSKTSQMFEKIY